MRNSMMQVAEEHDGPARRALPRPAALSPDGGEA
jgi:hypothetical protein